MWGAGYWHAGYWNDSYWGEYVAPTVDGQYWHANYWHANYWADGYWSTASNTQVIAQTAAAQLTKTAYVVDVDITYVANVPTQAMTLTPFAADAANDVTVEVTLATKTLTAIDTTQDAGEYYAGDISFTTFTASTFEFTDTVLATTATKTLTGISPLVSGNTGDSLVSVTSTPAKTLTSYNAQAVNPVVVQPGTASLTLTEYNVSTGFGTLANATVATKTLTPRQTNLTGTNADINEMDATLATMTLTAYNPELEVPSLIRSKGGRVKKRKRYIVEVDNKFFDVHSPQEAQRLLEQVADLAEENRVTKKPKLNITTAKGNKVKSKPVLKALEKTRQRINKVIRRKAVPMTRSTLDDEIANLMELAIEKEIQEDDEAILALLMM